MQQKDPTPSFRQLIIHTLMGAILGAFLALAVIVTNRHLFELVVHFPSPKTLVAVLMSASSFLIATGATLSGFIFTAIENELIARKERAINPPDHRKDSGT